MSEDMEALHKGPAAGKGEPRRSLAIVYLFALMVVLGGANLFWSSHEVRVNQAAQQTLQRTAQAAQQRTGRLIEQKLCATLLPLEPLAGLRAPAGSAAANPSRAYEQRLTRLLQPLTQLGPDLGCRKGQP